MLHPRHRADADAEGKHYLEDKAHDRVPVFARATLLASP
jgi:hypothetical protein